NTDLPPYLMLLIRPDGVMNYYGFQSAVRGLGIQFGYEMVDPDWLLEFPEDNEAIEQQWMVNNPNEPRPAPAARTGPSGVRPVRVAQGTGGGWGNGTPGTFGGDGGSQPVPGGSSSSPGGSAGNYRPRGTFSGGSGEPGEGGLPGVLRAPGF